MTRRQSILFRVIFYTYLAAVALLCFGNFSSAPSVDLSFFGIPTDKIVHFCMFFPFPVLAFLAFDKYTETARTSFIFVGATFIAGCLLAVITEIGQAKLTTYRSGDARDFLADFIALALSSLLILYIDLRKQHKKNEAVPSEN